MKASWKGWEGWLFAALALASVVPFWSVSYLPSTDGACHLYNAWVLRHYADPELGPLLRRTFEIDWRPLPNELTHLAMALLMWLVPPLVALKLVVSGLVLLLLGGFWYLAGSVAPERRLYAFLGLPFVWTVLLQFGFYNFIASVGFFLLAVGYWWRRRERLDLRSALVLNLLLLLCYFSHILSAVLALLAIALLWATTFSRRRWRQHLLHVVALAPQAVLPLWFIAVQGGGVIPDQGTFAAAWRYLLQLWPLFVFVEEENRIGRLLGALFVVLALFTLLRENVAWERLAPRAWRRTEEEPGGGDTRDARGEAATGAERRYFWRRLPLRLRREDGFLLVGAALTVLYFVSPEGTGGGTLLKPRLSLYPFLILVPWFSARIRPWGRVLLAGGLALLAVADLSYALRCYRASEPPVEAFVRGLDAARRGAVVLPLVFDRGGGCSRVGILDHATGYAAAEKGLVDWDNYEGMTTLFPLRFRGALRHSDLYPIEAAPLSLDVHQLDPQIDYVYCWRLPPHSRLAWRLGRNFKLVAAGPDSRLYERPR